MANYLCSMHCYYWLQVCSTAYMCASGVRHMEQWLAVIKSSKRQACLTIWLVKGQTWPYTDNIRWMHCFDRLVFRDSWCERAVHQWWEHVMQDWPLLEVMSTYVLLKQIYLTSNLHMSFILQTLLIIQLLSLVQLCERALQCPCLLFYWRDMDIDIFAFSTSTSNSANLFLSSVLCWPPVN